MKTILIFGCLALSACGYTSKNNELIGQVKKVISVTPLICPDRIDVNVSLGVMRNGVGSMSHEDMMASVYDTKVIDVLKKASESGAIVKMGYSVHRIVICPNDHEIISAEITP